MKKLTLIGAIIIATSTFTQVPNYVPTNGLVGWWPFNGNANDESGNGNNGIVNGATLTADRNGVANQAYSFDGLNNRIEVAHNQTLNCSSVTISVWFNTNNFISSNGYGPHILSKRESSGWGNSFQMNVGINQAQNALWADWSVSGNGGIYYNNSTTLQTNSWFNLVYTHDGTNVKLFLNGSLVQTIVSPGLLTFNSLPLWFGARPNAGNNSSWFNGKLDDIGIWNRALTACEIKDLYHSQLGYTTINAGLDQFSCVGEDVTLQGIGGNALTWNNGVINNTPFVPTQTNSYVLTGTDSIGCIGTDTVTITVLNTSNSSQTQTALDSYTWPVNNQTYTQSGTYSDTLVNTAGCDSIVTLNLTLSFTGINENNSSSLVISPNPTNGAFTIAGLELYNTISTMRVSDVNGKLVKVLDPTASKFNLETVKSGVYFLTITAGDKQEVIKIIKE